MIGCKKDSKTFRTNHRAGSNMLQKKELSGSFRVNKTLGYFELGFSVLDRKTEATRWNKENLTSQSKSSNERFYWWKAAAEISAEKAAEETYL